MFDHNTAHSSNSIFTSTKPSASGNNAIGPGNVNGPAVVDDDDDDPFQNEGMGAGDGMIPEEEEQETGSGFGSGAGEIAFQEQIPSNQIKCYDELGCIEITDEWFDILHRPLNLLPLDRHKIHTRFILYTRKRVTDVSQVSIPCTFN